MLGSADVWREVPMRRDEHGYHAHVETRATEGQRYVYRLDGGPDRPDPCSLWQPEGVFGASAVVFPGQFPWTDQNWRGVPRRGPGVLRAARRHVLSRRHVRRGRRQAARPVRAGDHSHRDHARRSVSGRRNWGYDGVLPYAAQNTYGGPHGLQRLVDACHAAGLAIFLDVVYNHFGPEGNYLAEFGSYFTDQYKTPWGAAVNYDGRGCDAVRDFVLDNVRMWLEEFHFDGLRLDAVHAIFDLGARHILRAIKEVAEDAGRGGAGRRGRRRERSQRPPPALLRASAADMDWTPNGRTTSTTRCTPSHWRARGVLRRFRRGLSTGQGPRAAVRLCLGIQPVPRPQARSFARGALRRPVRGLPPKSRPGGQPRPRRPAERASAVAIERAAGRKSACSCRPTCRSCSWARNMARRSPFPFSVRSTSVSSCRPCARAHEGVRSVCVAGGRSRPGCRGDIRRGEAELVVAGRNAAGGPAAIVPRPDRRTAEWPSLCDFQNCGRLVFGPMPTRHPVLELIRGNGDGGRFDSRLFQPERRPQPVPDAASVGTAMLFSSESTGYGGERDASTAPDRLYPFECVVFGPLGWRAFP